MKKIVKSIFICSIVCMLLIMAGCSKSDGKSNSSSHDIAGTYNLYSMRDAGTDEGDDSEYIAEEQGITGVLTLNQDGTGKYVFMGQTVELTYDTDKMIISAEGDDYTFEYENGVLRWMMADKIHTFNKQ